MLKKVLFILLSLFLGVLILINVYYRSFYTQFEKQTAEAAKSKEYGKVLQFYAFSADPNFLYSETLDNGMHVVIASGICDKINKDKNKDDKEYSYYSYEEGIIVGLFNIPKDFKTADTKDGDATLLGGVEIHYGDKSLFYQYGEDIVNGNSYYNYLQYYSFLPLNLYRNRIEADKEEKGILASQAVTGITIYDGSHTEKLSLSDVDLNFEKAFFTNYRELLVEYNVYQKQLADEKANDKDLQAKATELLKSINKVTDDNNYLKQHNVTIITKSGGFISTLIIAAVIFIAVDAVVGYFLLRKKKQTVRMMPKKAQQNLKANSTPEVFSRKDIIDTTATENDEATNESQEEKKEDKE